MHGVIYSQVISSVIEMPTWKTLSLIFQPQGKGSTESEQLPCV